MYEVCMSCASDNVFCLLYLYMNKGKKGFPTRLQVRFGFFNRRNFVVNHVWYSYFFLHAVEAGFSGTHMYI